MSLVPLVGLALGLALIVASRRWPWNAQPIALPCAVVLLGLAAWQAACELRPGSLTPTPGAAWSGLVGLFQDGTLWRYVVASVFRVAWGFSLAALIGIPLGLFAGWSARGFQALNPVIQGLRPISPIAWIPFAILWFGIADGAAVFLIFLSSFFPIVVGTMAAVRNISQVHVRSAQNFGLGGLELFRRVVFPAALPQILTALRLSLGIAWLVVVAAEMLAVNSGLGFLIIDARNMGMRYDLVAAGMIVIGLIGILLDLLVRSFERFDEVSWGYPKR